MRDNGVCIAVPRKLVCLLKTYPITGQSTVRKAGTEHRTSPWQGSTGPGDITSHREFCHLGPGEGARQGAQHFCGGQEAIAVGASSHEVELNKRKI